MRVVGPILPLVDCAIVAGDLLREVPRPVQGTQQRPTYMAIPIEMTTSLQAFVNFPEWLMYQTGVEWVEQVACLPVTENLVDPKQAPGIVLSLPFLRLLLVGQETW